MQGNSVSCLTATKDRVLVGTLGGHCFSFSNSVASIHNSTEFRCKRVSEHAVDGIACTSEYIWVSHTCFIFFLNPENLTQEGSVGWVEEHNAFIRQLSPSPEEDIIWSAQLGGVILAARDVHKHSPSFDIDVSKVLVQISRMPSSRPC